MANFCKTLILCLVLWPLWGTAADAEEIVIGLTEGSVGFSNRKEDGQIVGYNADIARLMCQRLGLSCRMELLPLKELIEQTASGKVQIAFGNLTHTPERDRKLLFSIPYWRSSSFFVGPRALSNLSQQQLLTGRRVGVQDSSRQQTWLHQHATPTTEIRTYPTTAAILKALAAHEVDLALISMLMAFHFLNSTAGSPFEFIGPSIDNGSTVHVVVSPNRPDLLANVNATLADMIREGTLQHLARQHLPMDIY